MSTLETEKKSKKPGIMDFAGILSEEEGKALAKKVKAYRKRFNESAKEQHSLLLQFNKYFPVCVQYFLEQFLEREGICLCFSNLPLKATEP